MIEPGAIIVSKDGVITREWPTGKMRWVWRDQEHVGNFEITMERIRVLQQQFGGSRTYPVAGSVPENFLEWRDVPTEKE